MRPRFRPVHADDTAEGNQSLWLLAAAPLIWMGHFLACYLTAALWCARMAGVPGSVGPVRMAVAAYTVVALVGIAIVGWIGFRRHGHGIGAVSQDFDTSAGRHRFLGFATLLLAALSAVAVLYVAAPALFFRSCL